MIKNLICNNSHVSRRLHTVLIIITAMLLSFILTGVIVHARNSNDTGICTPYYTNVTVKQGETLWSIAERYIDYGVSDSIYEYMDQLTRLNHLTSDNIYEGQKLVVVYYQHESE